MSHPERLQQTRELATMQLPGEVWSRLDDVVGPANDPEVVRWSGEL